MAYIYADTKPKVGFRPYGQTNPRHASILSGFELGQTRAFDPWILHADVPSGLGQVRPFDQDPGGWHLHGLGAAISPEDQALDELVMQGLITTDQADAVNSGASSWEEVTGAPDPTDPSSWYDLVGLFREVNADLTDLEQKFHDAATAGGTQAPTPNPALAAFGQELGAKRAQYANLAEQFTHLYTLVMGQAPTGLAGLGAAPLVYVAGIAVFVVLAFETLYAIRVWEKSVDVSALEAHTAQAAEQATQDAEAQAQAAEQAGDPKKAAAIRQQAALYTHFGPPKPPGATDWSAWLQTNAKWIGLAAVGMATFPALLGGRRR